MGNRDALVQARVDARPVRFPAALDHPPSGVHSAVGIGEREHVAVAEPLHHAAGVSTLLGHDPRELLDRVERRLLALPLGVRGEVLQVAKEDRHLGGAGKRLAPGPRLGLAHRDLGELLLEQPPVERHEVGGGEGKQALECPVDLGQRGDPVAALRP